MLFIETPPFERYRDECLSDEHYRLLQVWLMTHPAARVAIQKSGGIRKLRWGSDGRGKRGGLRIIYFYKSARSRIYFLTLYRESEMTDLSTDNIRALRDLVRNIQED